jgi:hypothetical protein
MTQVPGAVAQASQNLALRRRKMAQGRRASDHCAMAQEIGAMAQPREWYENSQTSSSSSQPQTLTHPFPLLSKNFQISNPKTSIINLKFQPKSFINTNQTPNSSIP